MSRAMFGNPKDDPWANKGNDDDDDWDTDPDFENKETIKQGSKKEEIVSAAEAQRQLRGELEDERAKKFGVAGTVSVDRGNYQDPGPARTQPTKTWNPQQELAGKSSVSAAKNAFSQPSYQEPERPAPRQAPKPAPVQSAPPPKPAAPPAKAAPPPPVKATPPPPAPKPAAPAPPPPAPAPVEESWDDQGGYDQGGYDQGGYDQGGSDQGGYDQGGYDQGGYDQGGYDQGGYDQGGYDQGGYDQGGYDQGYDQGGSDQGYDQGGYDQGFLGTCRALYDYPGESDTDLRFNAGDIISIVNDSDPSGWWEGDLNGARGYFPSNFVERL